MQCHAASQTLQCIVLCCELPLSTRAMSVMAMHAIMLGKYLIVDITPEHLGQVTRHSNLTRMRTHHAHHPKLTHGRQAHLTEHPTPLHARTVSTSHRSHRMHPWDIPHALHAPSTHGTCHLADRRIDMTEHNKVVTQYRLMHHLSVCDHAGAHKHAPMRHLMETTGNTMVCTLCTLQCRRHTCNRAVVRSIGALHGQCHHQRYHWCMR